MDLNEDRFDDLTETLREHAWRSPPSQYPRVVLVTMTFTARFHYFGSFWNALKTVLDIDEIDTTAWGVAFRTALKRFDLLVPPASWMVNVGPVLFHAIIPAGCEVEFAEFFDSLPPEVDLASMSGDDLSEVVSTFRFKRESLRGFMQREESREIALDLIRAVYSDLRLSRLTGAELSGIRGQIVRAIQELANRQTVAHKTGTTILLWKYGRSTNNIFLQLPGLQGEFAVRPELSSDGVPIDITVDLGPSGYILPSQQLPIEPSTEGITLELEVARSIARRYRVFGLPDDVAFFKLTSSTGSLVGSSSLTPGMYLILWSGHLSVERNGATKVPRELPLVPDKTPYREAAVYDLAARDLVTLPSAQKIEVTESLRPEITLQTESSWYGVMDDREGPVFSNDVNLVCHSPYDGAELVIFNKARSIVHRAFVSRASTHEVRLENAGYYTATTYLDGQPAGANVESFFVCDLTLAAGSWRNVESCDFLASGRGTIRIGRREIQLSNTGKRVGFDELAGGGAYYANDTTVVGLTYVGPRPLRWRLGSDETQMRAITLERHVSELPAGETIDISTNPGERLTLSIDAHVLADVHASTRGIARISIQEALDFLRRRDEMTTVVISAPNSRADCLRIYAVPRVLQAIVRVEGHYLTADLGLDRAVESIRVVYRPAYCYWEPIRLLTLAGGPRAFQGSAWIGDQPRLEVSVEALSGGRFVPVLDDQEPWSHVIGNSHVKRTDLEVCLAGFFETGQGQCLGPMMGAGSELRHALDLLLTAAMLPENAAFKSKAIAGLEILAPLFNDANIGILEDVVHGNSRDVASVLIRAHCPIPAVSSHILGAALEIEPVAVGAAPSLAAVESDIRQLLRLAEAKDGQATTILENIASTQPSTQAGYLALIATFLLEVRERSGARVLEQCDNNVFNRMCFVASSLLDEAGLSVDVQKAPLKGGPLTRVLNEYLRFAVAIRRGTSKKLERSRFRLARYYASLLEIGILKKPLSVLLLCVDTLRI